MKKFLSALTAFCMCASMTAASLPASALTMTDSSAITVFAGDCTWTVSNEVFDPATDEFVTLHVTVTGDTAAYGFEFTPYFDGKEEIGIRIPALLLKLIFMISLLVLL